MHDAKKKKTSEKFTTQHFFFLHSKYFPQYSIYFTEYLFQTDLQSEKYKNKAEISSLEVEVESLQLHIEQERLEAAKAKVSW